MPVQKIGDVIANSSNLTALTRQAQRLKALESLLFEATPHALACASRVTNLRSGTLTVAADNAAIAAKLRQLAPRLLSHMAKQGIEVTGIRVLVQVKAHKIKAEHEVTKRSLPPDAIQEFERLSGRLPPSPLKSALTRMVARRRAGKTG